MESKTCIFLLPGPSVSTCTRELTVMYDTFAMNDVYKHVLSNRLNLNYYWNTHTRLMRKDHIIDDIKAYDDRIEIFMSDPDIGDSFQGYTVTNVRTRNLEGWNHQITEEFVRAHWAQDWNQTHWGFGSSMPVMMQIAVNLGYDEIILFGADGYDVPGIPTKIIPSGKDPSRFHFYRNDIDRYELVIKFLKDGPMLSSSINLLWYYSVLKIRDLLGGDKGHFYSKYGINLDIDSRTYNHLLKAEYAIMDRASEIYDFSIYSNSMHRVASFPKYKFE